MSFRDQQFSSRFQAMGDEAEAVHDEIFPNHHKLGLNRPNMHVASMSLRARYTPDRQHTDKYVEVMGCGRDQILKVKTEKIYGLAQWEPMGPVHVFVWNKTKKQWGMGPLLVLVDALFEHGSVDWFPEGKQYVGVNPADIPFPWVKK